MNSELIGMWAAVILKDGNLHRSVIVEVVGQGIEATAVLSSGVAAKLYQMLILD
ncbi:hypothetical protein [Desulfobulbus oligotrophicus]|uniref:Uncharacterized protein n=1 Tax=Desulfobulbus oligotrophicus TaxID=1909699 RepID=A0A7T6AR23_9BACT|nr:hypothetical protein [Desulfobulbus oligotrophicus]QQG66336.1 hypothetical protein HP555_10895 [Desulfobulbus oligotrophicus]